MKLLTLVFIDTLLFNGFNWVFLLNDFYCKFFINGFYWNMMIQRFSLPFIYLTVFVICLIKWFYWFFYSTVLIENLLKFLNLTVFIAVFNLTVSIECFKLTVFNCFLLFNGFYWIFKLRAFTGSLLYNGFYGNLLI